MCSIQEIVNDMSFVLHFFRKFWQTHSGVRIGVFWIGSATITAIVIMVIATDWITWDRINRNFIATTGMQSSFPNGHIHKQIVRKNNVFFKKSCEFAMRYEI